MVKQIISDTFEQLGQTVKQAGQQAAKIPGELAEKAATQIGTKPGTGVEQPQGQGPTPAQIAQKEKKARRRLSYLEQELAALRKQQAQEPTRQAIGAGAPVNEAQAIKQIELQKEQQKELPPAVAQAKKKGGSGERKMMGGSG